MNRGAFGRSPVGPTLAVALLLLVSGSPVAAQRCPLPAAIFEDSPLDGAMAHVRYLADDALGGRAVASAGERCASFYIAERLRESGLEPGGRDGSYFHPFPVRSGTELGPDNRLSVDGTRLDPVADWTPLAVSASGRLDGRLVYTGYGVSRPGTTDRSSGAAVTGRVAVVESGDPDSPGGRSIRSDPAFKARVAAGRGAAALLVLLPEGAPPPSVADDAGVTLDIPVAVIHGAAATRVRQAAERGGAVALVTDVRPTFVEARNVVAVLPGSDPRGRSQPVVVGAHYDHLGTSSAGGPRGVYNGADDNASGTAALLEIAWRLRSVRPDRTVVLIAFTGEEQGLWGSTRFIEDPTVPLDGALAMVNLDMVGRLEDGPLEVHGTGTATEWDTLLRGVNERLPSPLPLESFPAGTGPSDHASFHAAGIPVLHLFTGTHADYHRPGDDWEKVDGAGLERIVDLASALVVTLATPSLVPALSPGG